LAGIFDYSVESSNMDKEVEVLVLPIYKRSMMILLLLAMVAAAGTMYGYYEKDKAVPLDAAVKQETATEEKLTVYITGAVNHPGVVSLAAGSRVADAVNACGGILPTADASALNMAQILKDGIQIRVPEKPANAGDMAQPGNPSSQGGLVNINLADEKTLDTLPGIGPAMAKRIVEYRQINGQFQSMEDLKKVRGIGDAKYDKLKGRITL
jgi:competence protein ComEA